MKTFVAARNYMIIVITICISISFSSANDEDLLLVTYNSSNCSVAIRANGSASEVDVVHNASMTMLRVRNTIGILKSQNVSDCNYLILDLRLLNSNMSFSSDQNGIYIQAVQLSASRVKFQNGTFIFRGSVLVPESSVMELDGAILSTENNSQQNLLTIQGGIHVYESRLDINTLISTSCDMMVAKTIVIPYGRIWTFESRVSMLLQASQTTQPWVLVVDGELRITNVADVIFSQGKVFISSSGMLILDGIAVFEALWLGTDFPSNGTILQPSKRTCVTGSGAFSTRLISTAGYEVARFEIFCIFGPNIHFLFKESNQFLSGTVQSGALEPPSKSKILSVELTLLVGLQSFEANFDSNETGNVLKFGFRVTIQNINENTTLDLRIKKLDATNLNLVGQIRVSCNDCYVHRLQILGSGTGVVLMKGGTMNCTMIQLENHLLVDGELSIRGNPVFKVTIYDTGVVQPYGKLFIVTIGQGAILTFRTLDQNNKILDIKGTNIRIEGLVRAVGTELRMDRSSLILNGSTAVFDVSQAIVRSIDIQQSKSSIYAEQGTICGPFGNIRLSIENYNTSRFRLSPFCHVDDQFPSTMYIQGNFSATMQTRIRNKECDSIKMTYSGQFFGSRDTKVLVTSAALGNQSQNERAVWQVYEGATYLSNQFYDYGDELQSKLIDSFGDTLRMGQFSNASGIFVHKCLTNFSGACTLCGPGNMMIGTECIPCEAGYFSASGLPHSCYACALGYFSDMVGSVKCKSCLPGYIRNISMTADRCSPCPAGFSSFDGISCQKCPVGYYSADAGSVCLQCPAGWITDESGTLCQPCPLNYFQTPGNICEACGFGFQTRFGASVVCEPCPLGMEGHHLGGCRACSPGTFGGGQSNNCSKCTEGTYSGYGFPSCIPCNQGEYSNGSGSAECRICAAGSFSKKQSSSCSLCNINTASNLSKQHQCVDCLSGNVAPLPGMTHCFPCPAQQNASSWISLVPDKLRRNASEAALLLAAVIVDESCFHIAGKTSNEVLTGTITASSTTVIAIICTVAAIIVILGAYFLKKQCKMKIEHEYSKHDCKEMDGSAPISEMPDNIRTDLMVKLGGQYFYQLIQRRRKVSATNSCDIELGDVRSAPAETQIDAPVVSCLPQISALIAVKIAPTEEPEGVNGSVEKNETSEQDTEFAPTQNLSTEITTSKSALVIGIPLAVDRKQGNNACDATVQKPAHQLDSDRGPEKHEVEFVEPVVKGVFLEPSEEFEVDETLSAQQQQYQGKKYSIDLESTKYILRGAPRYAVKAREQHGSAAQPTGLQ